MDQPHGTGERQDEGKGEGQGGSVVSTGREGAGGGPVGGAGLADGLISGCLALCLLVAGN